MTVILTYELNGVALNSNADRQKEFEDLVIWVVVDRPTIEEISLKLKILIDRYETRGVSKHIQSLRRVLTPVNS